MIWVYRVLFLPVFILSIPYILWHAKRRGGYKKDLHYKFGNIPARTSARETTSRIWIQAVSVGELRALKPLLEALAQLTGVEVILTTTTSTGYRVAHETYADLTEGIYYFPLDFYPFSNKAWQRIQPDLCLLMEGEIWPEHIHRARRNQVPLLLINGRLSDKTFRLYKRLGGSTRYLFRSLDHVIASSAANADRFTQLGTHPEKTVTVGNLKCDIPPPAQLKSEETTGLLSELGLISSTDSQAPLILCGASTWPGEEQTLVRLCDEIRREGIDLRLILTPRHVERRKEIEAQLAATGLATHFRSQGNATGEVQVAIADTTGELTKFIQLADIVFVGRSLPPHAGGQTPIEAAMLGKPVLFGPGMANFRDIARGLLNAGIATQVDDEEALAQTVRQYCLDPTRLSQGLDSKVTAWLKENQGATHRTLEILQQYI